MKRLIISMLILLTSINFATADNSSSQEQVIKKLPGALSKIQWKEQGPEAIEKILGKSPEKETKDGLEYYYYSFDGIKYDTSVVFKNNKISHIVFVPGNKQWTVKDFQKLIPAQKLGDAKSALLKNSEPGHDSKQSYSIQESKQGIELEITNNSKNSVEKLILWQPGTARP